MSPIHGLGNIQEQSPQLVDERLLALHLTPYRRVVAALDCDPQVPEIGLARPIVSKAAVLVEAGSILAISSAPYRQQHFAVELQHVNCVFRTVFVDCGQVYPRKEQECVHYFKVEKRQGILVAWTDCGRWTASRCANRIPATTGHVYEPVVPNHGEMFVFSAVTLSTGKEVVLPDEHRFGVKVLLITYQAHLATAGRRKLGFRRPRNHVSGRLAVDSRSPTSSRGRLRFVSAAQMSLVRNQEGPWA